jgi:chromosome segregation ATPase
MSGSDLGRTLAALVCGVVLGASVLPAWSQQPSREQEQVRRLRQQLQQLQQQQAEQQQAVQRIEAEKAQALGKLQAADADLKRSQGAVAARARQEGQLVKELQDLRDQSTRLGAELEALKTESQASVRNLQQQRNDQATVQRRLEQREAALADLQARHANQAQGLQACIANNQALYTLGRDLLQRYADKGISDVLAQSEPFLQTRRVAMENLLQGYQDKLDQQALARTPGREAVRAP